MLRTRTPTRSNTPTPLTTHLASAGRDEARFVRVDDRLHAVAEVELHQDVGDVRPDGGGADHERLGDLRVRQPASEQLQDFAFARRQVVERGRGWLGDGR